ncbi:MAG: hypothetical protein ABSH46_01785 [Bryobacteraceae bacterium]|jgi:hypothetical protein
MTFRIGLLIWGLTASAFAQGNWGKLKVNKMELTLEYESGTFPLKHKLPLLATVGKDEIDVVSNTKNYNDGREHYDPHQQLFAIPLKAVTSVAYANTGKQTTYNDQVTASNVGYGLSVKSAKTHYVNIVWHDTTENVDNSVVLKVPDQDYMGFLIVLQNLTGIKPTYDSLP